VWQTASVKGAEADARLRSLNAEAMALAAFAALIPDNVLEIAPFGVLNVHPSLLPRWRGAAPVERALMAGDARTGVTIHRTTAELDAGPIAAQEAFDVGPDDDAGAVFARSADIAARLLDGVMADPRFEPQPVDGVTYAEKIRPEDRKLDLSHPARENVDRVRALSPHIGARAVVDGRPLVVWKARDDDGELELLEVQPEGGRRMAYADYVRGRRA
jgi:methionyl-tRNA formyltransferase